MSQLAPELCRAVFQRLDDYLDQELGEGEKRWVESHLEQCDECAREARFEAALVRGIRFKLAGQPLPEDLMQRLSQRLRAASKAEP